MRIAAFAVLLGVSLGACADAFEAELSRVQSAHGATLDRFVADFEQQMRARLAASRPEAELAACAQIAGETARRIVADLGAAPGEGAGAEQRLSLEREGIARARRLLASLEGGARQDVRSVTRVGSEPVSIGLARVLRVGPLCAQCHGAEASPAVVAAFRALAPDSPAAGLAAGEALGLLQLRAPAR